MFTEPYIPRGGEGRKPDKAQRGPTKNENRYSLFKAEAMKLKLKESKAQIT